MFFDISTNEYYGTCGINPYSARFRIVSSKSRGKSCQLDLSRAVKGENESQQLQCKQYK